MVRVGIVGFGFMGKMHLRCYRALDNVNVVAVCDVDQARLKDTKGAAGNIEGAQAPHDLAGVNLYTDFDKMLAKENLDAVSITLPTFMHRDFTVKALEARVNVLCEKPMAMHTAQCEDMIVAAQQAGKVLQIGHCIRFWPQYAKTKQLINSGDYGRVLACSFRRLSAPPTWSWENWLNNKDQSGGALMDLHIHDTDFVQYLFGVPKAVHSQSAVGPSGGPDYVSTQYIYKDQAVVVAEGGFVTSPDFRFEMSFIIILEKATIVYDCTLDPAFTVLPAEGKPFTPDVEPGDGYSLEIAHFIKKITGQNVPEIISPVGSLNAVKIALAEKHSAQTKKEIPIL
jgi:predicted dehydrogenase